MLSYFALCGPTPKMKPSVLAPTEVHPVADPATSALASVAPPEPDLQDVDSIVAAALAAAEAELQASGEGTAPAEPGVEREIKTTFEEEDVVASLMSNPASQRSGVALTNWERFARPVELVILALVMLLLVVSRAGLDWARVGAGMSGLRACVRLDPVGPRCALSFALSASASRPAAAQALRKPAAGIPSCRCSRAARPARRRRRSARSKVPARGPWA
jgi:hypothetical protein